MRSPQHDQGNQEDMERFVIVVSMDVDRHLAPSRVACGESATCWCPHECGNGGRRAPWSGRTFACGSTGFERRGLTLRWAMLTAVIKFNDPGTLQMLEEVLKPTVPSGEHERC